MTEGFSAVEEKSLRRARAIALASRVLPKPRVTVAHKAETVTTHPRLQLDFAVILESN